MKYNFDEIIERRNTNAMNTDGFRQYIFHADENMRFPYTDEEFVRMWVADMEFATPDVVINAVKERLDKRIFGYTKIFGPDYYQAFVGWTQKRYDWSFPPEQLLTSPGIIPALYELVGHICKPGEKILMLTPSYAFFKYAADFNGLESVCSNLKNNDGYYTMDLADIKAKAADPQVTLCIFCNPHNPTGRVWTQQELQAVADICTAQNMWIISDEIHCDLLRKCQKHIPLGKVLPDYERLITCMAPSKTFNMAGFMFSNIIIRSQALRNIWNERHYSFENPLSIAAAQAAYTSGGEWLDALCDYLDANFTFTEQYLQQYLPLAKFKISQATYLAWVDVSAYFHEGCDSLPLYFANKAGVLLEGGNMFVANSDGYIRLNIACPRSMLETGLNRICNLLNPNKNKNS